METIKRYEDIYSAIIAANSQGRELEPDPGVDYSVYRAYLESKRVGADFIDFASPIYDVSSVVKELREADIKEFTISSGFSGLQELLWRFSEHGYIIASLVQVPVGCFGQETVPAVKLKLKPNIV